MKHDADCCPFVFRESHWGRPFVKWFLDEKQPVFQQKTEPRTYLNAIALQQGKNSIKFRVSISNIFVLLLSILTGKLCYSASAVLLLRCKIVFVVLCYSKLSGKFLRIFFGFKYVKYDWIRCVGEKKRFPHFKNFGKAICLLMQISRPQSNLRYAEWIWKFCLVLAQKQFGNETGKM